MGVVFDGTQVNVLIAFIGGVITFFASCLLPLVPAYLAYMSGVVAEDALHLKRGKGVRRTMILNGLAFTIGFISVFVILGATVNTAGRHLLVYRDVLQRLGGVFFIFIGLFMLEVIHPVFLIKEWRLPRAAITRFRLVNSYLVGITFGFAWTPCIGPVLAVILLWASQASTMYYGILLLLAYGIGLGLPFVIVALLFEQIVPYLKSSAHVGQMLHKVSAVLILIVGALLLLGHIDLVTKAVLRILHLNTLAA